jgi:hypothetical protein
VTWLRVGDTALTHPKVMRLHTLDTAGLDLASHVLGFVMAAASWSGQHNTDGFIDMSVGLFASPKHWARLAAAAVKVGILTRAKGPDGQRGWLICMDDDLFHLLSSEEIKHRREHRKTSRQHTPKGLLLLRDGDLCRYCGNPVNPNDHRGNMAREFDHPDPLTPDVLVVSCKACNSHKAGRDVAAAGMELLDPPDVAPGERPYLHPSTIQWLEKYVPHLMRPDVIQAPDTAPARTPATQPADAAAQHAQRGPTPASQHRAEAPGPQAAERPSTQPQRREATQPDPIPNPKPTPRGMAGLGLPGRDGEGRGSVGVGSSPPRAGPTRSRGSRGKRKTTP